MTFIRIQNAKRNESGEIIGGSASIVESIYVKDGKVHCKQIMKESLGTIILMKDRNHGIFLSKTRGLVEYDSKTETFQQVSREDPRILGQLDIPEPGIHTLFGDSDAVLAFMNANGILKILRNLAVNDRSFFERMICHTLHGVLRDGSRITCDRFVEKSFLSHLITLPVSTLRTDTRYFEDLGSYENKIEFFKRFIEEMRHDVPGFGRGCYVDSTPLPNSISDLPSNRLCSHGIDSVGVQTRLVLVLDIITGLPVWFDLIPGNVLDLSTIMNTTERVSKVLGIHIDDMVLDAGYVCKNVIEAYNIENNADKTLLARMPNKNGYHVDELFDSIRSLFASAEYAFVRQGHTYFGIRKEISLFGKSEYAYIYVDMENASNFFQNYMIKHPDEFGSLSARDKDFVRYKGGFFVLVSNQKNDPDRILDYYYGRTEIETVFRVGKNYLNLLPLNKQKKETVEGKVLQDIIDIIVYLQIRKKLANTGRSVSDHIYDLQSVYCFCENGKTLKVEYINKQANAAYAALGVKPPMYLSIADYRGRYFLSTF